MKQLGDKVNLKAIYSRSLSSVEASKKVAHDLGLSNFQLYHDGEDENLETMLNRKDIEAIIIALPIKLQPAIILKCLEAGKHVLSEKPVGKDVQAGIELLKTYRDKFASKGLVNHLLYSD